MGTMNPKGMRVLAKKVKDEDPILLEASTPCFTFANYLMANTHVLVSVLNPAELHINFQSTCKTDKKVSLKISDLGKRML